MASSTFHSSLCSQVQGLHVTAIGVYTILEEKVSCYQFKWTLCDDVCVLVHGADNLQKKPLSPAWSAKVILWDHFTPNREI